MKLPDFLLKILLVTMVLICVPDVVLAQGKLIPAADSAELAETLRQRLSNMGSRHLEYRARRKGSDATLEFVYSKTNRYWLITTDINAKRSMNLLAYVDLAAGRLIQPNSKEPGTASSMDIQKMLQPKNPGNPWSVYTSALEKITGDSFAVATGDLLPQFMLDLYFAQEEFIISTGLLQAKDGRSVDVSWLRPEVFTEAQTITQHDKEVVLTFPGNHRIRIELSTGLLLEDVWDDADPMKVRRISRVRDEPAAKDLPVADFYPKLNELRLQEVLLDSHIEPFFRVFISGILTAKVADSILLATLRDYRKPFVEQLTVRAVQQWLGLYQREMAAGGFDGKLLAEMRNVLEEKYRDYALRNPDAKVTLKQFIEKENVRAALMDSLLLDDVDQNIPVPGRVNFNVFSSDVRTALQLSYKDAYVAYRTGAVAALVGVVIDHIISNNEIVNPQSK